MFNTQLISYIFYEKLNRLNGERNNTKPKLSIIQKARKPCIKSRIKAYLPFQRLVDEDASLVFIISRYSNSPGYRAHPCQPKVYQTLTYLRKCIYKRFIHSSSFAFGSSFSLVNLRRILLLDTKSSSFSGARPPLVTILSNLDNSFATYPLFSINFPNTLK